MSSETNKAIVRRYNQEVWNNGREDLFGEYVAKDVVHHGIPFGPGLEGMKAGYAAAKSGFSGVQLTLDDLVAEGDKVAARWTFSGTHTGEITGIPATGKQVEQSGMAIYRLAKARIVELWFQPDNLGMMQQLGVIPTPEAV